MNLQTHLEQHHSVKLSNGVEMEKPEISMIRFKSQFRVKGSFVLQEKFDLEVEQYNAATKAIKLPDWMEFIAKIVHVPNLPRVAILSQICDFVTMMEQPPHIKHFVPWDGEVLEEPIWFNKWLNEDFEMGRDTEMIATDEWIDQCKQYHQAQQEVMFEGWKVVINNEYTTTISDHNGNIIAFMRNGKIEVQNNPSFLIYVETIDYLNQRIQLYMKIK